MFKIRHCKTGLYSVGGLYPTWSEVGVRWVHAPQLKQHVLEAAKRNPEIYREAEIVEVEEVVKRVVPFEEINREAPGVYVVDNGEIVPRKYNPGRKRTKHASPKKKPKEVAK